LKERPNILQDVSPQICFDPSGLEKREDEDAEFSNNYYNDTEMGSDD
jgi:hypothetical protein